MRGKLQGTPIRKDGRIVAWRVRVKVTTATGGKKDKAFERKTLREAQDAAIEHLRDNGRVETIPDAGTVADAIEAVAEDLWRPDHIRPTTRANYMACARTLGEEFAGRPIDSITPPQLTQYYKRFAKGSKRMMDEHWKVGRAVFGYAASDLGWIDRSPMEDARKPKATGEGREWPVLAREQFDLILPHLDETHRLFYRLIGETGARPSEAWGLDVGDRLEFVRDVWWFVVSRGKTEAATRRVPIPDALARDLRAAGPRPFAEIAGARHPNSHLEVRWKNAMKAAGVPHTRPYEVRAMRVNEWRRMAVPGLIRRTMVGHTSEKTTNDWYDHVDAAEVLKALGVGSGVGDHAADGEE
jgi:integrase